MHPFSLVGGPPLLRLLLNNLLTKIIPTKIIPTKIIRRPISLLRLSLLTFVDSTFPGGSPWAWEFTPQNWDSAWVKPSEVQNLSTEIGRKVAEVLGPPIGFRDEPCYMYIVVYNINYILNPPTIVSENPWTSNTKLECHPSGKICFKHVKVFFSRNYSWWKCNQMPFLIIQHAACQLSNTRARF